MSPPSLPPVYEHPSPRSTLLPYLEPLLPYPLPLVRRIQFHYQSPHKRAIATFPPGASPNSHAKPHAAFAALYLDRSRSPEAEAWIFSTAELPSPPRQPQDLHTREVERLQALALLHAVACQPLPPGFAAAADPRRLLLGNVHGLVLAFLQGDDIGFGVDGDDEDGDPDTDPEDNATLGPDAFAPRPTRPPTPPASPPHKTDRRETLREGRGVVDRYTEPYAKHLIPARAAAGERVGSRRRKLIAIPGLAWDRVRPDEFRTVLARTPIPRSEATLALLPSIAARRRVPISPPAQNGVHGANGANGTTDGGPDARPVEETDELMAWAFIGVDGTLTSLHVEERWRGRGLGKEVARRAAGLVAAGAGMAGVGDGGGRTAAEEEWLHSDVARSNGESAGVARALGGVEAWHVYWVWADLERVERWARELGTGAANGMLSRKMGRLWRRLKQGRR